MLNFGPIQELPLSSAFFRKEADAFLQANGLRMEALEAYYVIRDQEGSIIAGAGICSDIIKCVAVGADYRSEGLVAPLISHIISVCGPRNLKVFTKPENQAVFESLGFKLLASAPEAILMENGRGLEKYCEYLRQTRHARPRPGISGIIVMNANPFTLGHKYLIERALEQVDTLYIIPVIEDVSDFPYQERVEMIASALPAAKENYFSGFLPKNQFSSAIASPTHADATVMPGSDRASHAIVLLDGSDYIISSATFPTYFLKDLSSASDTQMRLDLDLFTRWIAPALGATVRFVGSEPYDALTARYNKLMGERIHTVIVTRRETPDQVGGDGAVMPGSDRASHAISASAVRSALSHGDFRTAASLTPASTHPYLLAALAERALRIELDTPLKPGLVGPDSNGAHKDMDYGVMMRGIKALRPFWSRMAMASCPEELKQLGIEAEEAMLAATGGVNTHRGAIFALGLVLNAFWSGGKVADNQSLLSSRVHATVHPIISKSLIDNDLQDRPIGAKRMALSGYQQLFEDWLPYYRSLAEKESLPSAVKKADAPGRDSLSTQNNPMLRETCPSGTETTTINSVIPSDTTLVIPSEARESHIRALLFHIMSTLDDTCVIKRVGAERAELVKQEAAEIAGLAGNDGNVMPDAITVMPDGFTVMPDLIGHLKDMCARYASEGISPGGAADMLALTIFIDSII